MPYYRVKLKHKGPFFKGINSHARKSTAIIHSDVLFSAFLCVSAKIDPTWLEENPPNFLVSSVYPYYKNIFLYPRPFVPSMDDDLTHKESTQQQGNMQGSDRKKWKKVKYVSEGLFAELLTHRDAGIKDYPYLDGNEENKGTILCLKKELDSLSEQGLPYQKIVTENYKISNIIDRAIHQATPYPQNFYEINIEKDVGLWFLVKLDEEKVESFQNILTALGKLGIGGERSSGFGHFEFNKKQDMYMLQEESTNDNDVRCDSVYIKPIKQNGREILTLRANAHLEPKMAVTLSLYHPTPIEFQERILDGIASYDCAMRGGWIHGLAGYHEPKKSVRMCIEGSVFPVINDMPQGDVIDLSYNQNPHPIWRSGLAFNIYFDYSKEEK